MYVCMYVSIFTYNSFRTPTYFDCLDHLWGFFLHQLRIYKKDINNYVNRLYFLSIKWVNYKFRCGGVCRIGS